MKNILKQKGPLRIGIDCRVLQDAQPSGIPKYAYHTINEMLKIDSYNTFILLFNSFRKIETILPRFEYDNVEYKIYHFPNKILEWFWKFIPYPKIDRVLNLDKFFSPHFLNIPLSKNIEKTVTIHDLSFLKNKRYFSLRKNIWHWQMDPRSACKTFDKIIAVSYSTKHDIIDLYQITPDKIRIIYEGYQRLIDFNDSVLETSVLDKYSIEKNKYILFLATLEPRKNIAGIIDAYYVINKKNTDIKLVIAGKKGWLFNNIFKKVKKYGLSQKIVFTDFISNEEKNILFKHANIFIFPSFCEGFGIPILEAVSYKIPIITSAVSSMPEIIKDSAIIINPHNVYDLAEALLLIKNYKTRSILKGKELFLEDFNWNNSAKKTLEYILS